MRTLLVIAALAAMASAQFKPYNPISVAIQSPPPVNINNAAPARRPAAPAPRPPPPPPPPPPVIVSTTAAPPGAGAGAGGLFGADGLGGGGRFGGAGGRGGNSGLGSLVPADRPAPITAKGELRSGSGTAEARNNQGGHWTILRQSNDVQANGYLWDIETENGIGAREQGELRNIGTQDEAMLAQGYYEYTGPDGILYRVDYTADEGGFRAEGAHLPTPPPIPEAIQRALAYIAANPPKDERFRRRR